LGAGRADEHARDRAIPTRRRAPYPAREASTIMGISPSTVLRCAARAICPRANRLTDRDPCWRHLRLPRATKALRRDERRTSRHREADSTRSPRAERDSSSGLPITIRSHRPSSKPAHTERRPARRPSVSHAIRLAKAPRRWATVPRQPVHPHEYYESWHRSRL